MSSSILVSANAVGWLKEDAAIKEVSGFSVAEFCIKVNKYNRKTKEKDMVFINCQLWGKKAESVGKMLRKGKYVSVLGSIDSFRYPTVNVQEITLLIQSEEDYKKPESNETETNRGVKDHSTQEIEEMF